jgi:hypothetical protein
MRAPLPLSLGAGLVCGVLATIAAVLVTLAPEYPWRWYDFAYACQLAAQILVIHALVDLARRGAVRRTAMLVAIGGWLGGLAWLGVQPALERLVADPVTAIEWADRVTAIGNVAGVLSVISTFALVIATRGFTRTPAAATLLLAIIALSAHVPGPGEQLWRWLEGELALHAILWLAFTGAFVGCMVRMISAVPGTTAPDVSRAAMALRRFATTLVLEIVITFAITIQAIHATDDAPSILQLGQVAWIVVTVIQAWSLLVVASSVTGDLPRGRVVAGGVLTLWWAGTGAVQLGSLHGASARLLLSDPLPWQHVGPLLAAGALVLVCSALASFAKHRGVTPLHRDAAVAASRVAMFGCACFVLDLAEGMAPTAGGAAVMALADTGLTIAMLVTTARLCWRAAQSIEESPQVPPARTI